MWGSGSDLGFKRGEGRGERVVRVALVLVEPLRQYWESGLEIS